MIAIFVPIHFLRLGFDLRAVFIFLMVQWFFFSLFVPIAAKLISKIGIKEVILIRTPLFIVSLLLLGILDRSPLLQEYFLLIAVLLGISLVMYTLSISSLFAEFMHKKRQSSETGKFIALPQIGAIIGPVLGGLLALFFGFDALFIISSVLLFLSIIPIGSLKHKIDHPKFDYKKFILFFKTKKKIFFFINLYGIKGFVMFIILPIAVYFVNYNVLILGIIMSLSGFVSVTTALVYGRYMDAKKMNYVRLGAVLSSLFFMILSMITGTNVLLYVSIFSGAILVLLDLPFETELFMEAKKENSILSFLAFKEMSFLLGRTLFFIVIIYAYTNINISFLIGSASSLLISLF